MSSRICERARPHRPRLSRAGLVVLAALGFAVPGRARGESPEEGRERARVALQEGARLIEEGRFQEALARFQEAYGLVPSPKIHYNFGVAYLGMGREPEAFEAFEAFLREMPDPPALQRDKAAENLRWLRQRITLVSITCDVDGAKVVIDGRVRGVTPLGRPVALAPGAHEILVEREGSHAPVLRSLFGAGGQKIEASFSLQPKEPGDPGKRAGMALGPVSPGAPPATGGVLVGTPAPSSESSRPLVRRVWFWTAVGAAVVAAAIGVALVVSSGGEAPPSACPAGIPDCFGVK